MCGKLWDDNLSETDNSVMIILNVENCKIFCGEHMKYWRDKIDDGCYLENIQKNTNQLDP